MHRKIRLSKVAQQNLTGARLGHDLQPRPVCERPPSAWLDATMRAGIRHKAMGR
jgi:hypothetical protein